MPGEWEAKAVRDAIDVWNERVVETLPEVKK
jgi:hypothetical protein